MSNTVSEMIRASYCAYETEDRALLESVLAPGFTFTSPRDDHIGRAEYFQRCWPNSKTITAFRFVKLLVEGLDALVLYDASRTTGPDFRNVEFFTTNGRQITSVEVYFGRNVDASSA